MSDDLLNMETRNADKQESSDEEEKPSSGLYRGAHFPAFAVLGLLFLLVRGNPWRWQIAISGAYTVYVFFFALGSFLKDADDFFGNPAVQRNTAKLKPAALPLLLLRPAPCRK